jgi:1-acyl-sn-glycerol-3-phosphate acyltransferase
VIVPIAVTSGRCWRRASFAMTPGLIDVVIGQPIECKGGNPDQLMRQVREWTEAEMRRLEPEVYA